MNRLEKFKFSKNFIIYYGHNEENALSKYDIAIIEPNGHTKQEIEYLKREGTLTIGYISVVEINPQDRRMRYLKDEDFIRINGAREVNTIYGNYLADISSQRWQDILMHEVGRIIDGLGYDGIFLDTVGNVEHHDLMEAYGSAMMNDMVLFMKRIRAKYPDHIIIQNNAVEKLINFTANIVDAICWENPPFNQRESRLWMKEIIDRLSASQRDDNLKILIVLESDNPSDYRRLQQFDSSGYLTYLSPYNYLEIPK